MYEGETIKFLFDQEKEVLFKVIENDESIHKTRNKAIFLIAEYGALRASEIGMIKMSDINITRREIYFKRLKNSNNNTLRIIDETVYNALLEYIEYRHEHNIISDYLFVSQKGNPISRKTLDSMMKSYCRQAGIPKDKSHFHALKHTRAVSLAELGLDTKEIQYWIGHKRIQNTEIYLQFTSKQKDALYQKIASLLQQNYTTGGYYEPELCYISK